MNNSKDSALAVNVAATLQEFIKLWERKDFAAQPGADAPTRDEVAYCIFENIGAFERYSSGDAAERLLEELKGFLSAEREELAAAALPHIESIDFMSALTQFVKRFDALDGEAAVEESIEFVLSRDEAQMALRSLQALVHRDHDSLDNLQRRATVARSWHRVDEYWKSHIECFFGAVPWMKGMLTRFDIKSLDRSAFWWWFVIPETFDRIVKTTETPNLGELLTAKPRLPEREWKLLLYGQGDLTGEDLSEVENYLEANPDEKKLLLSGDDYDFESAEVERKVIRLSDVFSRLQRSLADEPSSTAYRMAAESDMQDTITPIANSLSGLLVHIGGTEFSFILNVIRRDSEWFVQFNFIDAVGNPSSYFDGGKVRLPGVEGDIWQGMAELKCSSQEQILGIGEHIKIEDSKGQLYEIFWARE